VPARLFQFTKPVYVRLFAHASLLLAGEGLEEKIRQTFMSWIVSQEGAKGFWDVGANIGLFSFTYASVHPKSPLISFEPNRRNLECLRRTMSAWNLPSHQLVPSAVSDHTGQASFKIDRLSGTTGTLLEEGNTFNEHHYAAKTHTEVVEVVRLDDFYNPQAPLGLVKIDVEGAELAVLRRAQKLLSEASPSSV
jgi:FkbM family methyltransferase